ncbi:IclR family transcriptional regulator [Sphingomonas sp. STIS6.2]|uniref:IclR family transcriptional regulator n=1 Tax=Sphingomonas sp. STIS6.2 TaxID=1379700 RepID=UPI00069020EC|nr:IclR family transcriptional regulator [Sphingomonas sp. STIS6.2]
MTTKSRYQAPALKKGLEILELLAAATAPLNMSDISTALGRSVSEIFRMLQVLEEHRYIARGDDGYRLTNRLFALGMSQPPVRNLVGIALPVMSEVARRTGQSCHMAVASGAEMVVIVGVEAPSLSGFAIRVGYRRPLHRSASGRVLLAFQSADVRQAMLDDVRLAGAAFAALAAELDAIAAKGLHTTPSPVLNAITDMSVPILVMGSARAALTVPFVDGPGARVTLDASQAVLRHAAATIAEQLSPEVRDGLYQRVVDHGVPDAGSDG